MSVRRNGEEPETEEIKPTEGGSTDAGVPPVKENADDESTDAVGAADSAPDVSGEQRYTVGDIIKRVLCALLALGTLMVCVYGVYRLSILTIDGGETETVQNSGERGGERSGESSAYIREEAPFDVARL